MNKKTIDQEQLKQAVLKGVEEYLRTDTTDYDNFVGIMDFARSIWYYLDKRGSHHKVPTKLKLQRAYQIHERVEKIIGEDDPVVSKGLRFWKNPRNKIRNELRNEIRERAKLSV